MTESVHYQCFGLKYSKYGNKIWQVVLASALHIRTQAQ